MRIVSGLVGIGLGLATSIARAEDHSCEDIKAACERQGFVKADAPEGRALWSDCIEPSVLRREPPEKARAAVPTLDDETIKSCRRKHGYGDGTTKDIR